MEKIGVEVSMSSIILESAEGSMLKEDEVREELSGLRGERRSKQSSVSLGWTEKRSGAGVGWGGWYRQKRKRRRKIDLFSEFITSGAGGELERGGFEPGAFHPGVYWDSPASAAVRTAYRSQSRWAELATVCFQTELGEQKRSFGSVLI